MDLSETTAPRSDQQNFDDYVLGPKVVTISKVKAGSEEQPVEIHLEEFPGRPYKPSRSMRRVLVAAWGPDASEYTGRKMKLYGDPSVRFGPAVVGGIKISHLSHIDKPVTANLTVTRGKRAPYTVHPLAAEPVKPATSLKSQVWERSQQIEPDLADDERRNWIKGELADLGGDTPENLTALLSKWEAK